ncbi:MAG: multimeric flavodoxin WrbA [Bacteroidia bacterium]|jgi:multimeric flavodoxin WrbA
MNSKVRKVIINGSSNANGETEKAVSQLILISKCDVINLKEYNITHFDYEHKNREDDFIELMKRIENGYDVLIFATPVYWYSMSGIMKVFFDRFSDLLSIEKAVGRKLSGKYMAAISSSNGDNLGDDFWLPFRKTATYLGMKYISDLHVIQGELDPVQMSDFMLKIDETASL